MVDYLAFIGLALSVICFMINRTIEDETGWKWGLSSLLAWVLGGMSLLTKLIYMVAREFPH